MDNLLSKSLIKAIANNQADEIERLLIICDLLHKGLPSFQDENNKIFTPNDLPTDELYEEGKDKLKQLRTLDIAMRVPDKETITDRIQKRKQDNVLMYMDGIQAPTLVPTLEDVILMPKFDGCSVGVEIIKQIDDKQNVNFVVSFAHTRGSDDITGKRKCQTKTELIKQVFNLDKFNELFNKLITTNETFELTYKDEKLIGNNNPVLTTRIKLNEIDKIVLRGEFVNKDRKKLPQGITTNIGLAAGTINADVPQYVDYLCFQPFEISSINTKHINRDDSITEINYIPTQLSSITFMKILGLITYPLINMNYINHNTDMSKIFNYFLKKCTQPLDGIVYCQKYWTYPKIFDETSKRVNYGKYKWKPHNSKHSVITNVEYNIGKTGKITPIVYYDSIKINDKNYNKTKTTFTRMIEFGAKQQEETKVEDKQVSQTSKDNDCLHFHFNQNDEDKQEQTQQDNQFDNTNYLHFMNMLDEDTYCQPNEYNELTQLVAEANKQNVIDKNSFGKGLLCEIELKQDIAPYISQVFHNESNITEIINIPITCPWCNNKLSWSKTGKDLMCVNDKCKGVNVERLCDFLKQIGIKGIQTKTCQGLNLYDNDEDNQFNILYQLKLKKEIHESGVAVRRSIKYVAKKTTPKTKPSNDFNNIIENITVGDFIVSCSLLTKKKCDDWLLSNHINRSTELIEWITKDNNIDLLNTISNYFVNDLIMWLINEYKLE